MATMTDDKSGNGKPGRELKPPLAMLAERDDGDRNEELAEYAYADVEMEVAEAGQDEHEQERWAQVVPSVPELPQFARRRRTGRRGRGEARRSALDRRR